MKNKQKGFTLTELLAVVVILALIILIALYAIIPMTQKARKRSFGNEMQTYIKNAEVYYESEKTNEDFDDCKKDASGNIVCAIDIKDLTGQYIDKNDDKYNGCIYLKISGSNVTRKVSMSNGSFKYTGDGDIIKYDNILDDTTEANCTDFGEFNEESEEYIPVPPKPKDATLLARKSYGSNENYYAYASKIVEIEFVNHTNHGADTIDCDDDKDMKWCVAQTDEKKGIKRDAIIAWFEKSEINTSKYKLYIGSEKKIYAPEDSSYLFGLNWLKEIKFSNFDTSKVKNMTGMFYACTHLTGIDLKNFDTSNVTNMNSMFYWCIELTSLDLSSFNVRKVENMYQMFRECSSLKSVTFGNNFVTSSVINMSAMFLNCQSLTTLDLSSFDTSNVTNMNAMFYGCGGLENLDLSHFNTKNVENMGQMFFDCSSLTSITFGDNFDTSKVTTMSSIFAYAKALKTLDLSGFDTKYVENMAQMFFKCSSLISITFGDNFNTSNVTNKIDMFSYCKSLTKIYLNNEEERTRLSSLKPASAKYYNY